MRKRKNNNKKTTKTSVEDTRMAKEHVIMPKLTVIRETQIKRTVRLHLPPTELAKLKSLKISGSQQGL